MRLICRKKIYNRLKNLKGLWFHIIGLACLIWIIIRVTPAPHRSQYPCQLIAIPIAIGYIAFWSILLHSLKIWMSKAKTRTTAYIPAFLIFFILMFSITGAVFAFNTNNTSGVDWEPTPKNPIGTPIGAKPGRVVWVWNPEATKSNIDGLWWNEKNNNQEVINNMFSDGIKGLTDETDDYKSWDTLFKYFNQVHDKGEQGYKNGEKIAIKVNLNNCYDYLNKPYTRIDNERDESPYVVKTLLKQLTQVVGVKQEDITIYDSSRAMANWFYNRVYYEKYPAFPLVPEYPNVNYIDTYGGAHGRKKATPSNELIHFADGTGLYRTLPESVVNANYIINMPLLKRHPSNNGNGVTLSAKNFYGTWIEPVVKVHKYHESGHILDNPTPQTDLLAHEHIGQKTLLYIGDGMYPTIIDHKTLDKFQMYPFNNDWTNSLFFSQDPVAIDSVMYDFLHTEGTKPSEGSQNYLHQAAQPTTNVYDPENDGIYLNHSLGVHEHWDKNIDIFSPERYSGPENNGIDFIAIGQEHAQPYIVIHNPKQNHLYFNNKEITVFPLTIVFAPILINVSVNGVSQNILNIEFYIDNDIKHTCTEEPYNWYWQEISFSKHELKIIANLEDGNLISNELTIWKYL